MLKLINLFVLLAGISLAQSPFIILMGDEVVADPYGDELLTNGTFTGDATGWNLGGNATYDNNNIIMTGNSLNNYFYSNALWPAGSMNGKTLHLSYEVTENSLAENGTLFLNNAIGTEFSTTLVLEKTVGIHTYDIEVNGAGNANTISFLITYEFTSGTIHIDNISLKEVLNP